MLTLHLRLASFLALAPLGTAQNVVFQDGFENGLQNWTVTGLWHVEDASTSCLTGTLPLPDGSKAAWYGRAATCNFDDGTANFGQLRLANWVQLPSNVAAVTLYFDQWVDSEYCWSGWDRQSVVVTAQNGVNGGFTTELCAANGPVATTQTWHERRVDLSAYQGADVKISFSFVSGDNAENAGLGWIVDNVRIVTEAGTTVCPSSNPWNTCPCSHWIGVGGGCLNSLSRSATLVSGGSASVSSDSLTFTAADMPPGTAATLFQATAASSPAAAFGDGLLCVTGTLTRLGTQFAPTGSIGWPLPSLGPISTAGFVSPSGGDYFYQVIYRDAVPTHCTSATFNQTSAQRVSWQP